MARPKLNIDEQQVYKLAKLGCKTTEIADVLECDHSTILNRFSHVLTKGRAELRTGLRTWQLQCAQKGNVVMLIWLGKNILGQQDSLQIEDVSKDKLTPDILKAFLTSLVNKKNDEIENEK